MAMKKAEKVKYLHLPLDPDVHRALKMHCVTVGVAMQDFAIVALTEKLQRGKKKP